MKDLLKKIPHRGLRREIFLCVRLAAHVSFARHGRALAGESPEHAQVVGNV